MPESKHYEKNLPTEHHGAADAVPEMVLTRHKTMKNMKTTNTHG